ncbi:hypothetical protein KBD11_01985 [Candidatus Saccharibacteria bacterium]|nr:hypothetical protein [Candidatus Saccharibacteria bacterium]
MRRLSQVGIGHIVALLVVAILAVVGFTGYKVYSSQDSDRESNSARPSTNASSTDLPKPQSQELKAVDSTLNQADKELEATLDASDLDQDIEALL